MEAWVRSTLPHVAATSSCVIVFAGETLARLSGGTVPAPVHYVNETHVGRARYSMPFFLRCHPDGVLPDRASGSPVGGTSLPAGAARPEGVAHTEQGSAALPATSANSEGDADTGASVTPGGVGTGPPSHVAQGVEENGRPSRLSATRRQPETVRAFLEGHVHVVNHWLRDRHRLYTGSDLSVPASWPMTPPGSDF